MLRRLRLGLSICCLLAALPAAAAAKDRLTLCFERQEVLPWRTLDGGGLNFDLLNEVARQTGVEFDYQSMPWKRCLAQLQANQVDGAFAASFNRERMAIGAFPGGVEADPARRMHADGYMLVRRKGSAVDWDGKQFYHLEGRIGVQLGYSIGDVLRARNIPVDDGSQRSDELMQKLLAGRVAAVALGGGDAVRLVRGKVAEQVEIVHTPLEQKPYYLMLSHAFVAKHPAQAERIWKAIEQVRTSAAYQQRAQAVIQQAGGRH